MGSQKKKEKVTNMSSFADTTFHITSAPQYSFWAFSANFELHARDIYAEYVANKSPEPVARLVLLAFPGQSGSQGGFPKMI